MILTTEAVTVKSYTIRDEKGFWLAQVVLTSDGMFSAVSDYGNFAFAWRSIGDSTIEEFICHLNNGYFAMKMALGLAYSFSSSKKIQAACDLFTENILPPLMVAAMIAALEALGGDNASTQ